MANSHPHDTPRPDRPPHRRRDTAAAAAVLGLTILAAVLIGLVALAVLG